MAELQNETQGLQDRLSAINAKLLRAAKEKGATQAEIVCSSQRGLSLNVRNGDIETLEHIRSHSLGMTVFLGHQKGTATTTDFSEAALMEALEAALQIAQSTEPDPYAGLAEPEQMAYGYADLDLYTPWASFSFEGALDACRQCEVHAKGVDPRIRHCESVSLTSYESVFSYANSHGFIGGYPSTRHSMSCSLVAEQGEEMQRDSDYTVARDALKLWSPERIAKGAATRTLQRLGARRPKTCKVPVLFATEVSDEIIECFTSAIRGAHIYRRSSFLVDHIGKAIFPSFLQITEHPHLMAGLGSAPFDSDGVATREQDFIRDGVLQRYILGAYSARKLGLQTTGNASGTHNLTVSAPKAFSLKALLQQMGTGLYVTELMGSGINLVTGDYSQGAVGFWVENGEIQYPVEEITVAGSLPRMFSELLAIGEECDPRRSLQCGALLIAEMMVGGA